MASGKKSPKIHFIGIGGIGISALSRYFLAQNWPISGSDASDVLELKELRKEGVKVKIGHRKSNIGPEIELVIYSQAVPPDNPEILEAKRRKISLKSYPEALGELTRDHTTVAVAGAHGKSTTSSLLALIFKEAGLDPTVVVGTKLKEFNNKNFRIGKSKYLVIEADEYKDSFLNYYPRGLLITNIDREHLDYYKNLRNIKKSFLKLIHNTNPGGILVLNKDNKNLYSIKSKIRNRKVYWYSLAEDVKHVKQIEKHLKLSGVHNLSNALGAFMLAKEFGIKEKGILSAISKFKGTWRRMEYKGTLKDKSCKLKTKVYDDYAHHPAEIKATLSAFKEKFPDSFLICIFQPHQIRRLKLLFNDFVKSFDNADVLVLLDIYKVSGREVKGKLSHNAKSLSEKLAKAIARRRNGPKETVYLPHSGRLKEVIQHLLHTTYPILHTHSGAVVVMMGAGNIVNLTPKLLK